MGEKEKVKTCHFPAVTSGFSVSAKPLPKTFPFTLTGYLRRKSQSSTKTSLPWNLNNKQNNKKNKKKPLLLAVFPFFLSNVTEIQLNITHSEREPLSSKIIPGVSTSRNYPWGQSNH